MCGKTNNNNNKDRSDEKPHFCWINVYGRGLLALRGGWGRQQGSACGDAPHPEVAGRHKACSPCLPGKSRECPTSAPQDGGCNPWHAMAKEDIATGQPPDFYCSEQQPYKMPRFPIYTTSILGSSGLSGVIQLLFLFYTVLLLLPRNSQRHAGILAGCFSLQNIINRVIYWIWPAGKQTSTSDSEDQCDSQHFIAGGGMWEGKMAVWNTEPSPSLWGW